MEDHFDAKASVEHFVRNLAIEQGVPRCLVHVKRADDPQSGAFHLTVTRTSAEAGDDGQVGRGNSANGLTTPYRPMMLDAVRGNEPGGPCWQDLLCRNPQGCRDTGFGRTRHHCSAKSLPG
jgi:S-adenosylmethionine synthetase